MRAGRLLFWALFLGGAAYWAARYRTAPEAPEPPEQLHGPGATIEATLPRAPGKPLQRVLFIGNSMVYTWAMPRMLVGLARADGINLEAEHYGPGGSRLIDHSRSAHAHKLLAGGGWHSVVLQEQSQWPAFADAQVRAEVDPPASDLAQRARSGSPSVQLILYMTPARRNGDLDNAASIPELATYDGMQNRISATYRRLARMLDAGVAPVGEAWRAVRRDRPDIELYGDETHPNKAGAYLVACVFYGTLFDRSPVGSAYDPGLEAPVRAVLQQAAWAAVQAER